MISNRLLSLTPHRVGGFIFGLKGGDRNENQSKYCFRTMGTKLWQAFTKIIKIWYNTNTKKGSKASFMDNEEMTTISKTFIPDVMIVQMEEDDYYVSEKLKGKVLNFVIKDFRY